MKPSHPDVGSAIAATSRAVPPAPSFDVARRRLLHFLAGAGLLTGAERLGLIRAALANGANPVPPGLHQIKGTVSINNQPARPGQLIKPGDKVTTGSDGEAIYVIAQDAFLQRSSSTVHFGPDLADFMRVVTGRLLSVFGKGERTIRVSTATIGIRGTACYIEEEPAEKLGAGNTASRTYFCLCYGTAHVTPRVAPQQQETIITAHHDHPMYIHDDPRMPTSMVDAKVINHFDAELTLLENLVGRWPPFTGQGTYRY